MTRETKVGLIVGLAFITVFAVILSHKGAQPRATIGSDVGPLVDANSILEKSQAPSGLARNNANAAKPSGIVVELHPPAPAKAVTPTPVPAPNAGNNKPVVPLPSMPEGTETANSKQEPLPKSLNAWLDGITEAVDSAASMVRKAPAPASTETNQPSPNKADAPNQNVPSDTAIARNNTTEEEKTAVKQEYVAQKGDTLSRIASKVYGTSNPKSIEAIVAANPKELPNANSLKAGAKLIIPELPSDKFETAEFPPRSRSTPSNKSEELTAKNSSVNKADRPITTEGEIQPVAPEANPSASKSELASKLETTSKQEAMTRAETASLKKETAGKATGKEKEGASAKTTLAANNGENKSSRTHTVREKETLGDIAQKYLGSSTRWKEIHKLNEGKYPDPSKIRAGALLKLPTNTGGTGKERTQSSDAG